MTTVAESWEGKIKELEKEIKNKGGPKIKATNLNKKKDYTAINEANFRLIDYIVNML